MKNLFSIITGIGLLTVSAQAQFATGPRPGEATTVTPASLLRVNASSVSNLVTGAVSNPFRITSGGNVAFFAGIWSSNASTADVAFQFQVSPNGSTWFTPPAPQAPALTLMKAGGTTITYQFTNAWTSGALANMGWIRASAVSNGHTATLFVTNATFYQH